MTATKRFSTYLGYLIGAALTACILTILIAGTIAACRALL